MKFHPALVQTRVQSPLGPVTLAASSKGLAGLWFDGQRHLPLELSDPANYTHSNPLSGPISVAPIRPPVWLHAPEHPVLAQTSAQLVDYFAGRRKGFDVPLDLGFGTPFQQAVWQALLAIEPGKTLSYGEVSRRIGKPQAVRAVGAAIGRNPVSIVVPCHRVLGGKGLLTGYAGGLDKKTALLQLEGALQENRL